MLFLIFFLFSCNNPKDIDSENSTYSKDEKSRVVSERSSSAVKSESKNVKEFGVMGDGMTDDTETLRTAFSKSSNLYFPKGSYILTEQIILKEADTVLTGEKDAENKPLAVFEITKDVTLFDASKINGLTLDGLYFKKTLAENSSTVAIVIEGGENVTVKNCEVSGYSARAGLDFRRIKKFEITDNYLHDFSSSHAGLLPDTNQLVDSLAIFVQFSSDGLIARNVVKDIIIRDPLLSVNRYQSDGITLSNCENVLVEDNEITNVGDGMDFVRCSKITIRNNRLLNCHHVGFKLVHATQDSIAENNYIENATMVGIGISGGSPATKMITTRNIIRNNTIVNVGGMNIFNYSFYFAGIALDIGYAPTEEFTPECTGNIIEYNTIIDNQAKPTTAYGIFETESAEGNTFRKNKFIGNIGNKIVVSSESIVEE